MKFNDLTFVIAVWGDYTKYLDNALQPLLTLKGARIVIVDNGVASPIAASEAYEIVKTNSRLTAGAARNFGFAEVETEFVCFTDVDDIANPEFIEVALTRLRSSNLIAFAGKNRYADGSGQWPFVTPRLLPWFPKLLATRCLFRNIVPVPGAVLRAKAVRDIGGFADQDLHEDWTLSAVLPLMGRYYFSEMIAVQYLIHEDSKSHKPRPNTEFMDAREVVLNRFATSPPRPFWAGLAVRLARRYHLRRLGLA